MKSFKEVYRIAENKIPGIGAAPGIIIGEAYLFTKEKLQISKADIDDIGKAKNDLTEAIAKSKKALESNDLSTMKSAEEELTRSSHKLAEAMYAKASQKGAAGPGAEAGPQEGPRQKPQEDVVDADFEDVGKK